MLAPQKMNTARINTIGELCRTLFDHTNGEKKNPPNGNETQANILMAFVKNL